MARNPARTKTAIQPTIMPPSWPRTPVTPTATAIRNGSKHPAPAISWQVGPDISTGPVLAEPHRGHRCQLGPDIPYLLPLAFVWRLPHDSLLLQYITLRGWACGMLGPQGSFPMFRDFGTAPALASFSPGGGCTLRSACGYPKSRNIEAQCPIILTANRANRYLLGRKL